MFGSLGAPELIIIGLIVVLLFGVGKISGLGREVGSSIKEFRKAVKDEDAEKDKKVIAAEAPAAVAQQPAPPQYVAPQPQYAQPPHQYAPQQQPQYVPAPQQYAPAPQPQYAPAPPPQYAPPPPAQPTQPRQDGGSSIF